MKKLDARDDVAFAVSFGWGPVYSSSPDPVQQDLQDNSESAFAMLPEEADSRTSDPAEADLTAKACLLPRRVLELETALRLADVATLEGKGTNFEPWYEFAQGLAAYRTQNYHRVEERLTSAEQSPAQFFAATATLLRSMTRRQLKQPQEADQLLQQAQQHYEKAVQTADKKFWEDRLVYEVLYEEARTEVTNEQH